MNYFFDFLIKKREEKLIKNETLTSWDRNGNNWLQIVLSRLAISV